MHTGLHAVRHAIPNWLLLTSVYLFGGASVLVVEHAVSWNRGAPPRAALAAAPPETGVAAPGEIPAAFGTLDLSAAQRSLMVEVVEKTQLRIDSISGEVLPGIQAIWKSQQQGLFCLLTPAQQGRYRATAGAALAEAVDAVRCGAVTTGL